MNSFLSLKAKAVLVGVPSLFLFGLFASSSYRSDQALIRQFYKNENTFETLVIMAQEDSHLIRIADDFTWLDTDVSWPRNNVGISEERWNEYRKLFRRAGATEGIAKNGDAIFFPIAVRGLVPSSQEKGIAYSSSPLTPVVKSLDVKPPLELYDKREHVLAFRPFKDNWYIFYEEF